MEVFFVSADVLAAIELNSTKSFQRSWIEARFNGKNEFCKKSKNQQINTCSKWTIETIERGVVVNLVVLLLTLKIFLTFD